MTQREKVLVELLIWVLAIGLIGSFVLTPIYTSCLETKEVKQTLEDQKDSMDRMIAMNDLDAKIEAENTRADKNYDFFYSVLNSYNIDQILNNLVQGSSLTILSMQISDYQDAAADFAGIQTSESTTESNTSVTAKKQENEAAMQEAQGEGTTEAVAGTTSSPSLILKSTVDISVTGQYQHLLEWIDNVNMASECLRIEQMSIQPNVNDATGKANSKATMKIGIYGIKKPKLSKSK